MNASDLAEALNGRWEGTQYRCLCPVHNGHSLMVKPANRSNPLVSCFGGCDFRDIVKELEAIGLWEQAGRPPGPPPKKIEWAKWFVRIYKADAEAQRTLSEQDLKDFRKAQAILREAKEVGRA